MCERVVRGLRVAGGLSSGDAPVDDGGDAARTARGGARRDTGTARGRFRRIVRSRGSRRPRSRCLWGRWEGTEAPTGALCTERARGAERGHVGGMPCGCNKLPNCFLLLCIVRPNLILVESGRAKRGAEVSLGPTFP